MQRKWKRRWQRLAKIIMPPLVSGMLMITVYNPVYANPTGGTVTSGAATIAANGSTMTVTQTTGKTAINWQSFNIASGEKVQFVQPSANAVALNRVVGNDASAIYGTLSANGKVYLINPNGVLFAPGAQVSVGGLVASTLNLSDNDFTNGKYTFSGNGTGSVVNQGNISAANEAVLIGPQVKNEGVIAAKVAGLAAGNKVSLDFSGDNLLNLTVDTGAAGGSATNSGTIAANGGLVVMSAGTKNALLNTVVNNSGIIRAQSVNNVNGVIRLEGNTATNSGTLDASGKATGQTGGTVKVLGDTVVLAKGSTIDVAGDAGGGTALIGGNFHGAGEEYAATNTTVEAGATINANAITSGDGGQVAVWSKGETKFAGTITAQGGQISGSGGQVETSGHTLKVADTASVNTTAAQGRTGSWLLDPNDFTIAATGGDMTAATLETALKNTDVTIGSGNTNVNEAVDWSSHTLTLSAYHNIYINAALNLTNTAGLALAYGQGAVASGNTSTYTVNAPVNLASTASFSTKLGSDGTTHAYTIVNGISGLSGLNNSSDYYAMGTNLDYSGQGTLGSAVIGSFSGTFAGLGHTISNLTITSGDTYVGLFGESTGSIRDVGLVSDTITGTGSNSNVGGLVGQNYNGTITDCYATGTVSGTGSLSTVGGLVGQNCAYSGTASITDCYATGTVSATGNGSNVGGLVGENYNGTITDCYATGAVSGTGSLSTVGGLVGLNAAYRTASITNITDCYTTGVVSGNSSYVGGLVGYNYNGTITDCYWDVDTSGQTTGVGFNSGGTGSPTALYSLVSSLAADSTRKSAFAKSSYAFTNFYTNWYMVDGSTRPFLRSEYSTTITNAHQLQLMSMNPSASYTLANNIDMSELTNNAGMWRTSATKDASGNYGFVPVGNSTTSFSGTFDGLGHTISGLTITSNANNVGLFGYSSGTIRDVGLINDTVTGTNSSGSVVGGLVGYNISGTITDCYATGAVTGTGNLNTVGGLVGENFGYNGTARITDCYATGAVSSTGSGSIVGGLVGNNYASDGTARITDCYATGVVTGAGAVGGLVGNNYAYNGTARITDCYATGAVTGTGAVGGLVGQNSSGTITDCYWDVDTSGQTTGVGNQTSDTAYGINGQNGKTTVDMMQQATFSNWDFTNTWGIIGGKSYPYLKWRYTSTPEVVSGTLTNGGSALSGETVQAAVNGTVLGSTVTGKNGFYYLLLDNGTLHDGAALLTYVKDSVSGVKANGVSEVSGVNSSVSGLGLTSGTVTVYNTSGSTRLGTALGTAKGSLTDSDILYSTANGTLSVTGNLNVASAVGLDRNVTTTGTQTYGGAVTLDSDSTLTGSTVIFGSTVDGAHNLTVTGNGVFGGNVGSSTKLSSLTVSGTTGITSDIAINTTGNQEYDRAVDATGRTLSLASGGSLTGKGGMKASALKLAVTGVADLSAANQVGTLAGQVGSLNFVNGSALTIGTVGSASGLNATGDVLVTAPGLTIQNLVGAKGISSTGGNITLVLNGGSFTNSDGADAIDVSKNNRWLLYSAKPADVSLGGLGYDFTQYNITYGGTPAVAGAGNGLLFANTLNLSVGLTGTVTKGYDGTTTATLDKSNVTVSGLTGATADYTVSGLSGSYNSANVAQANTVTVSGGSVTLHGLKDSNSKPVYGYTETNCVTNGATINGTITPATITLNGSRVYDGTTTIDSSVFGTVSGVNSETLSLTGSGSIASKDVGQNVGLTIGSLALGNGTGLAGNYTLAASGSTVSITPKTITAGLTGTVEKTYDGSSGATLTNGNYTLNGVIGTDQVALNDPSSGSYDTKDAGSGKTVTVNGLLLNGSDAKDYELSSTSVNGAVGKIDKATLTVKANGASKTYDGKAYSGGNGVQYSGFVNHEDAAVLNGAPTYGGTSQGAVNVGTYSIIPGGFSAGNYDIVYAPGTLMINQAITQPVNNAPYLGAISSARQSALPVFGNPNMVSSAGLQTVLPLTIIPPGINISGYVPLTVLGNFEQPEK